MANLILRLLRAGIIILPLLIIAPVAQAEVCPSGTAVCPPAVNGTLPQGGTLKIEERVTAPVLPPTLDIFLLEDETGSLNTSIANLKTLAPQIWDAVAGRGVNFTMGIGGFRDFARNSWGGANDWVYRRLQDLTTDKAAFINGVNQLSAATGNDKPEAYLEALHYIAVPGHPAFDSNGDGDATDAFDTPAGQQPSWRPGARRIVFLITDAPCHVTGDAGGWPGDPGTTSPEVTANILKAAGITVIGLTPLGTGNVGSVDTLANITGGSVQAVTDSGGQIKEGVIAGINSLTSAIWWEVTADAGLAVKLAPVIQENVKGGAEIAFQETISAAGDAAPGSYHASVNFFAGDSSRVSRSATGVVDILIEVLPPLTATAPDFVIDMGTPINDRLFIDHGAGCTPGCTLSITNFINNTVPGRYPYTVVCTDGVRQPVRASGTVTVIAPDTVSISLEAGWNLVSLPCFIAPDKGGTAELLSGILDNMDIIYSYDAGAGPGEAWKTFVPSVMEGSLKNLKDGYGYWIHMKAPDVLVVKGPQFPDPPDLPPAYNLCLGWNLIGVRSNVPVRTGDYLASLAGKYVLVYRFSGGAYSRVQDNDLMLPGQGFWIAMVQPGLLQY